MIKFPPILIGLFVSGIISVLGAPVFGYLWGSVHPASTMFVLMTIVIRVSRRRKEEVVMLVSIIAGIFFFDFLMGKYYDTASAVNNGTILLVGSLVILALTVLIVPIIGLVENDDKKAVYILAGMLAFVIYSYGIVYGGITPGVSDGPKLASIISIILVIQKKFEQLDAMWIALLIMGILGNFIIPLLPFGGVMRETF